MTDSHLASVNVDIKPNSDTCEACVKAGTKPVQLNLCLSCGNVACCDSSRGRHATKHFEETGHPIVGRLPLPLSWKWCYADKQYVYDN